MQNAVEVKKNGTVVSKVTNGGDIIGTPQTLSVTAGNNMTLNTNYSRRCGNIIIVCLQMTPTTNIVGGSLIATLEKALNGSAFLSAGNNPQAVYISGDSVITSVTLNANTSYWFYGVGIING